MSCSVLTVAALRICLATIGLGYILITNPASLLLGPLANFVLNFLPDSTSMNLLVPGLTSEVVSDSLLIVGLSRSNNLLLLPWLGLNIMFILGLGTAVMALMATADINTSTDIEHDQAMKDVRTFLLIIILNIFMVMVILHLHGVIQVSQDMKEKKAGSDSETSSVDTDVRINVIEDQHAGETLRKEGVCHDSSFDSYDEVP